MHAWYRHKHSAIRSVDCGERREEVVLDVCGSNAYHSSFSIILVLCHFVYPNVRSASPRLKCSRLESSLPSASIANEGFRVTLCSASNDHRSA